VTASWSTPGRLWAETVEGLARQTGSGLARQDVGGLASRLDEAHRRVEAVREDGVPLPDLGDLFPESEEVVWGNEAMRVDHASLRAEAQGVRAAVEGEARRLGLDRLRHRLEAVRAELGAGGAGAGKGTGAPGGTAGESPSGMGPPDRMAGREVGPAAPPPPGWREKLAEIMGRPEFKKEESRQGLIELFLQWLRDKLGFDVSISRSGPVRRVLGWIVYALAGAAAFFVLVVLVRVALPLLRRDRPAGPPGRRAAPAPPETPENLLALAEARARAGEWRGAVQAMFRWLLLRLHQAGRLEYDPALTNREHLARLKADAASRAAFTELSGQFELAWYALGIVTAEEYAAFRRRCQQLAGGPA
jgi:hypothetical protein